MTRQIPRVPVRLARLPCRRDELALHLKPPRNGRNSARLSWRLLPLLTGRLFASGGRTVSRWLRAGQLSKEYQDYYYFLCASGCKVELLAGALLRIAVDVLVPQDRLEPPNGTFMLWYWPFPVTMMLYLPSPQP